jgi:LacI family transcriptional regulator/LacI family asc operon transcriptional repressor
MNIYDIASKAGVSVATVSRVLNNSPRVSQKSKEKVQRIMDEEGYVPNIFARGLSLNSVKSIGILCPVISDINHAAAVSHIERLLRTNGFDTILASTGSYEEDKSKYLDFLLAKRVDAILCVGSGSGDAKERASFERAAGQVPVVVVNGMVKAKNVYCALCDEEGAVLSLVEELLRKGYRSIAYFYDTETYSGLQKLSGYRKGLAQAGLGADQRIELKIDTETNGIDASFNQTNTILDAGKSFSALIAADDIIAVGAQKALKKRAISIPIIGFNNSRFAQCADPEISSIDTMIESLCTIAVQQLLDVLQGRPAPERVLISASLVQRESFIL